MQTELTNYEWLLECLAESRERLRVMQVSDEQQNIDLTKAFYRLDLASAAITALLADTAKQLSSATTR